VLTICTLKLLERNDNCHSACQTERIRSTHNELRISLSVV